MNSAALVWPLFNSLQAFWPGLQVIMIICSVYCLMPYHHMLSVVCNLHIFPRFQQGMLILLLEHIRRSLASGKDMGSPQKVLISPPSVFRYMSSSNSFLSIFQVLIILKYICQIVNYFICFSAWSKELPPPSRTN